MEDQSSQAFKVVYNLVGYTIFEIDCEFRICETVSIFHDMV